MKYLFIRSVTALQEEQDRDEFLPVKEANQRVNGQERLIVIVINEATGQTSVRRVFAGGDIVLGAATVILAMGHGRVAARAMDLFLKTGRWEGLEEILAVAD